MRKISIVLVGFLASNSYGQCTISGNSTIKLNETAFYSVDAKAQCEECYLWASTPDQNFKIDGSSVSNKVNVKAGILGKNTLSVTLLNGKTEIKCEKVIEVVNANQTISKNKCGVNIDDFKDVKVSESTIWFFPNENFSDYSYEWTVTYSNNEVKVSTEKIPQFFFSEINYIKSVKLKITSKKVLCTISVSKNYDQNYWKPTTSQMDKVEQKVYSPGSYSDYVKSSEQPKTESSDKK